MQLQICSKLKKLSEMASGAFKLDLDIRQNSSTSGDSWTANFAILFIKFENNYRLNTETNIS